MLRRVAALIGRDLKSSGRDLFTLWFILAPFVLALMVRAFVPAVSGSTINLVTTDEVGAELIASLRQYGNVEVVADKAAVDRRVMLIDDVAGVVREGGTLRLVLEGNERDETARLPGLALAAILGRPPVELTQRDLGRQASPLRPYLVSFLAMASAVFGGVVMGFAIVEDKTMGTMSALGVTPLSGAEYLAGRATVGAVLSVIFAVGSLYVVGAAPFDLGQVLAMSLGGAVLAVVLGLYVGSIASNSIEAIGTFKFGFLPFWIVPVLGFVIPKSYHFTLYWMPTYWLFFGFRAIFLGQAGWPEVWRYAGAALGVGLLFLLVSWRLLRRRLLLKG